MMNPMNLWDRFYGSSVAHDFSGRKMIKAHYGRSDLATGWNVDHIIPLSTRTNNRIENLLVVNCRTNAENADKNPFIANGKRFQVKRINGQLTIVEI